MCGKILTFGDVYFMGGNVFSRGVGYKVGEGKGNRVTFWLDD